MSQGVDGGFGGQRAAGPDQTKGVLHCGHGHVRGGRWQRATFPPVGRRCGEQPGRMAVGFPPEAQLRHHGFGQRHEPVFAAFAAADMEPGMFGVGVAQIAQFNADGFADPQAGLIHAERTAIIDRNGQIVDLLDAAAWNPDDVAAEVRSVSEVPSNLFARIDYELSKASAALCGNSLSGYSGLLDLAIVAAIFAGACSILYFCARKIFVEEA